MGNNGHLEQPIWAVQCAATSDDSEFELTFAKQQSHDHLIERHPERLSPVYWLVYDNSEADRLCEMLGGPYAAEEGAELRRFCRMYPGGRFIVAMVMVPASAAVR